MAFMVPEYFKGKAWVIETEIGGELVLDDVVPTTIDIEDLSDEELVGVFGDYLEGIEIYEIDVESGWFAHLTAPGYMDQTEWSGPYKTKREAEDFIEEMYDVDAKTGESLYED